MFIVIFLDDFSQRFCNLSKLHLSISSVACRVIFCVPKASRGKYLCWGQVSGMCLHPKALGGWASE